ncbi:MAG TPA: TfoX/Sxy family protein [Propionibacteriaceae bacterium]|nr:TfoX/Sxy family protein [Propionibacteriaceae bacterium]
MFGGLSFLVDDRIVVAARAGGDLLVRIDPQRRDEFLGLPGVSGAAMAGGRTMGRQWITVVAAGLTSEAQLRQWLDVAFDQQLPSGPATEKLGRWRRGEHCNIPNRPLSLPRPSARCVSRCACGVAACALRCPTTGRTVTARPALV